MSGETIKRLVIAQKDGVTRACLLEDGVLTETLAGAEETPQLCSNVYLGRVERLQKAMQAAFIDIGLNKNALLSGAKETEGLASGEEVIVQVTKLPGGEKGVVVSRDIRLAGRLSVLLPFSDGVSVSRRIEDEAERERLKQLARSVKPENMGLIVRTNAVGEGAQALKNDAENLLKAWRALNEKARYRKAPALLRDESSILYRAARDIFCEDIEEVAFSDEKLYNNFLDCVRELCPRLAPRVRLMPGSDLITLYRIGAQLEKATERRVKLKSGAFLVIDRTEAMWVIDVNSGKFTGKGKADGMILAVNLEAAREIARQMRLRDMGGIIVVDFIDMDIKSERETLIAEMKKALKDDKNRSRVIDLTPLGLMEMTRKKKHEPA